MRGDLRQAPLAAILLVAAPGFAAGPPDLVFAWPDGAQASVSETIERKGQTFTFSYRLLFRRQANGSHLLEIHDARPVPGGRLNPTPLAATLLLMHAPLSMTVSDDGEWAEVVGLRDRIAALQKELRTHSRQRGDETLANIAALYDGADLRGMLHDKFAEQWGYWVTIWLNAPAKEKTVERYLVDAELMGIPYRRTLSLRHAGFTGKGRAYAKLEASSAVADPRQFAKALRRMDALGEPFGPALEAVETADRREKISAVIEATTLRPISVDVQREFVTTRAGRESRTSERRQTRFAWAP